VLGGENTIAPLERTLKDITGKLLIKPVAINCLGGYVQKNSESAKSVHGKGEE